MTGGGVAAIAGAEAGSVVAVDIGGTKVAVGRLAVQPLRVVSAQRLPSRDAGGHLRGRSLIREVRDAVASELSACGPGAIFPVGVTVPEIVGPGGELRCADRERREWASELVRAVGQVSSVALDSDVRAGALAESVSGTLAGAASAAYVTAGTGISYSALSDGLPVAGAHGGALNLGTSALGDPTRGDGYCGHLGSPGRSAPTAVHAPPACRVNDRAAAGRLDRGSWTLETSAAGPAIERDYELRSGRRLDARQVAAVADRGDPSAVEALRVAGRRLGLGVALVINLLDPEAVAVGGGLSDAGPAYWNAVVESVHELAHAELVDLVTIAPGRWRGDAGLVGAALVALWEAQAGGEQRWEELTGSPGRAARYEALVAAACGAYART